MFLLVLLVLSAVVAGVLVRDGNWLGAGVAAAAALYFGLRVSGRLGARRGDRS